MAGIVVGAGGGLLFWLFPAVGVLLLLVFVVPAALRPSRGWSLSGLLIGAGAGSLAILGQATIRCVQFNATPGQECIQPDLTPWFLAAGFLVVSGLALLLGASRSAH